MKQPQVRIPAAQRRVRRSRGNMRLMGTRGHVSESTTCRRWSAGRACLTICVSLSALLLGPAVSADSAGSGAAAGTDPASGQLPNSPLLPVLDYSRKTDHELTRIGARWDELGKAEKTALLKEVKLRMAQRKDADGVLVIRTQRRYGSVYGGGRYLKIETRVIRVRPSEPASGSGFGVGYERRSAEAAPEDQQQAPDAATQPVDAPVVRVADPSR